jgi:hypothetical protein
MTARCPQTKINQARTTQTVRTKALEALNISELSDMIAGWSVDEDQIVAYDIYSTVHARAVEALKVF